MVSPQSHQANVRSQVFQGGIQSHDSVLNTCNRVYEGKPRLGKSRLALQHLPFSLTQGIAAQSSLLSSRGRSHELKYFQNLQMRPHRITDISENKESSQSRSRYISTSLANFTCKHEPHRQLSVSRTWLFTLSPFPRREGMGLTKVHLANLTSETTELRRRTRGWLKRLRFGLIWSHARRRAQWIQGVYSGGAWRWHVRGRHRWNMRGCVESVRSDGWG
jgi:hypothetical protein